MVQSSLQSSLQALVQTERAQPWNQTPIARVTDLLGQVAERFFLYGDALVSETAERMGVTAGEVWFEVVFPSVWGILLTRQGLLENSSPSGRMRDATRSLRAPQITQFAGRPAIRVLPANRLEALLLPGFSGHVLLRDPKDETSASHELQLKSQSCPIHAEALALCLLPFNLASIGALDIVHLLCRRQRRVMAKVSEKVEFVGPYLEKIFEPFVAIGALQFAYGGPDVGAWLAAQAEFDSIHLTGSARTATAIKQIAGCEKLTSELGGVTPAIVFPDAVSTPFLRRQVARQIAFGALANNGQHCVSFQVVLIPESAENVFAEVLWEEMARAARREQGENGVRRMIDVTAAGRLEAMVADLVAQGAQVKPESPKANESFFPACFVRGIGQSMRIFREEAFGPIVGLLALPDQDFPKQALALAKSNNLSGDLGISLFTADPRSTEIERFVTELRHGMVMINTYPGIAFATSVPWGAGPQGLSGHGWVHNYGLLNEASIEKVVISTSLGRKGIGPLRWEDPWLLNVTGDDSVRLARALVQTALAYFSAKPWELFKAQLSLVAAIVRREWSARLADRGYPAH